MIGPCDTAGGIGGAHIAVLFPYQATRELIARYIATHVVHIAQGHHPAAEHAAHVGACTGDRGILDPYVFQGPAVIGIADHTANIVVAVVQRDRTVDDIDARHRRVLGITCEHGQAVDVTSGDGRVVKTQVLHHRTVELFKHAGIGRRTLDLQIADGVTQAGECATEVARTYYAVGVRLPHPITAIDVDLARLQVSGCIDI